MWLCGVVAVCVCVAVCVAVCVCVCVPVCIPHRHVRHVWWTEYTDATRMLWSLPEVRAASPSSLLPIATC